MEIILFWCQLLSPCRRIQAASFIVDLFYSLFIFKTNVYQITYAISRVKYQKFCTEVLNIKGIVTVLVLIYIFSFLVPRLFHNPMLMFMLPTEVIDCISPQITTRLRLLIILADSMARAYLYVRSECNRLSCLCDELILTGHRNIV